MVFIPFLKILIMNKLFRALIAGYGAKKLGGGCLSTILVFIVIYYALGTCNKTPVQTAPQNQTGMQVPAQNSADAFYLNVDTYSLYGNVG